MSKRRNRRGTQWSRSTLTDSAFLALTARRQVQEQPEPVLESHRESHRESSPLNRPRSDVETGFSQAHVCCEKQVHLQAARDPSQSIGRDLFLRQCRFLK